MVYTTMMAVGINLVIGEITLAKHPCCQKSQGNQSRWKEALENIADQLPGASPHFHRVLHPLGTKYYRVKPSLLAAMKFEALI